MSESHPQPSRLRRFAAHLAEPIDPASVAVFRMLFGLMLAYDTFRQFYLGYFVRFYFRSEHKFHYYGFDWVTIGEPQMGRVLFAACLIAALMVAVGLLYRF